MLLKTRENFLIVHICLRDEKHFLMALEEIFRRETFSFRFTFSPKKKVNFSGDAFVMIY